MQRQGMRDLDNLSEAIRQASKYLRDTWQQTVMGNGDVPNLQIKANINLRRKYADSIVASQVIRGVNMTGGAVALDPIAKDLEYGKPPFDMKPMLLGGPKARMGKNGRYNIIPFRHAVPSKNADANFRQMPKDVYKQARNLKATVAHMKAGQYTGKMNWGGKTSGTEAAHPAGKNPTTGYEHKAGKYEGMYRIEKKYRAATQSKYLTFRVVSEKSDPGSWWHPGYEPQHIARTVANWCRKDVEEMIRDAAVTDLVEIIGMNVTVS